MRKKKTKFPRLSSKKRSGLIKVLTQTLPLLLIGMPDKQEATNLVKSSYGTPDLIRSCADVLERENWVGDENLDIQQFLECVADLIEKLDKKIRPEELETPAQILRWFAYYLECSLPPNDQRWDNGLSA